MQKTKTFAMVKPGAVHRGLIGEIIKRFENKGLNIVGMKMLCVTKAQASEHYKVHIAKPFYNNLVEYIMSAPVVVLVIEGENAIEIVRKMAGDTNPLNSAPGTIRGDYSADIENNIIHTSDGVDTAKREINIYFKAEEIIEYNRVIEEWSFGKE
ncbi:MAG: nucleoside-diphosphate kinase [Mycoplasmatales bacterium]